MVIVFLVKNGHRDSVRDLKNIFILVNTFLCRVVGRTVCYLGTHDNDTVLGWTTSADPADVAHARRYLHVDDNEGFNWAMMRAALGSVADTAILMMQDLIGLGSEARINTPSTLGGNWQWRISAGCANDWLANIIRENTALYGRLPKPTPKSEE